MTTQDKKLIKLSLVILFLSILIVYILLYQIKGNKLKGTFSPEAPTSHPETIVITSLSDNQQAVIATESTTETGGLSTIHMLSGTKLFYGKIESLEKLGVSSQYTLLDGSGTFFINLTDKTYDFESIVRTLGGNIYKVTTEQEIIQNKLFGDKIIYLNLPEYKDKTVLMLIYVNKEVRLIQIDYKIYHSSKSYLKSLFID